MHQETLIKLKQNLAVLRIVDSMAQGMMQDALMLCLSEGVGCDAQRLQHASARCQRPRA